MSGYSLAQRWQHFRLRMAKKQVIQAVPMALLRQIISDYLEQGWERDRMHIDVDIHQLFDCLSLRKGMSQLDFRCKDEHSGEICGPDNALLGLAKNYDLKATRTPR
ncbi:hypothetical protein [Lacimicrobium sp. SS2-24]|uniref:hypothetical protein n=1 Tax=Lacimicrobium sp. SS2-24 TaxID=2005569 RepID=UPI000B4AA7D8|nr:hypothetical protein [Lacimicrobium sp. SS2-24]